MPTTPPHSTPHASRPHTNHPLPTTIWLPSPDEPHAAPAPGTVLPDWAIERIRTVFTTRAGQLPAPLLKFTVQDTEPGMVARTPVITYTDGANLAHVPTAHLLEAFTEILAQCRTMLRPGGTAVITTRPWRERGELIDLPSAVLAAGKSAGLIPTERCVALLAGIRNNRLITRPSFFQMKNVNHARRQGIPLSVVQHEDVVIFTRPATRTGRPCPKSTNATCPAALSCRTRPLRTGRRDR
ncbi:hypothetical protein ACFC0M_00710 [Streptomyces sp. NPDC056149]|uniref:hypothetical protein n=1 Tax=Streptomyces sp. NPDC056149 TaxID=3345728 RepID=UPI0035DE692F